MSVAAAMPTPVIGARSESGVRLMATGVSVTSEPRLIPKPSQKRQRLHAGLCFSRSAEVFCISSPMVLRIVERKATPNPSNHSIPSEGSNGGASAH